MTFAACAGPAPRSSKACRTRTIEGFIDGLFGDVELMELPERANEALDNLGKIYAMTGVVAPLWLRAKSASCAG